MATSKTLIKHKVAKTELDSTFFLKLVMYLIVGSQWLRITIGGGGSQVPLPVGLFIGILFVSHDHFRIDRKIEMAVLLVATMIGFYGQVGVFINL
jgi:hypothetical protein